jgi:RNA-directed DNA polymerase
VHAAYRSLAGRLKRRKLQLHSLSSGKTQIAPLTSPFGYLGYRFEREEITVREATVERFLQSIAGKFSDFTHNKVRRLEKFKYLTEARLSEIFLEELNERISGAVSEKKRYGWIAYFNQMTDLTLLYKLDSTIASFFSRLPEFGRIAPDGLKKLSRAHWEMKFDPQGGYIRDYDRIQTRMEKLNFLLFRGRIDPEEALTDEQIEDRYENYVRHVLSAMHADEGSVY